MTISEGQRLPDAKMIEMGANGPETVDLAARIKGRKVVMFGLPGAFTGPCSTIHLPSFVRTAEAFRGKGVDEIICVSVNDPFVLSAWAESSGGKAAGIAFLGDPDAGFTKALKMEFTAPHLGLIDRSSRYAVLVEDGVITKARIDKAGECDLSTGETLLAAI
jgi:glutaredoxin/glutathione-dependent peroxiredoxin